MERLLDIIIKYKLQLFLGIRITLVVSVVGIVLGFILGVAIAMMKMGKIKVLRWFANVYVEFVRGTPVLVQIFMVYYGLPLLGIHISTDQVMGVAFDRLLCGCIALVLNSSAYICEILRAGVLAIDKGQTEAGLSLGFSKFTTMMVIVLPQAFRDVLPSMGNEFINLVKASSQVSVIGLADLMYEANVIRAASFEPFIPYVIIAITYLIITNIVSQIVKRVEHRNKKYVASVNS